MEVTTATQNDCKSANRSKKLRYFCLLKFPAKFHLNIRNVSSDYICNGGSPSCVKHADINATYLVTLFLEFRMTRNILRLNILNERNWCLIKRYPSSTYSLSSNVLSARANSAGYLNSLQLRDIRHWSPHIVVRTYEKLKYFLFSYLKWVQ